MKKLDGHNFLKEGNEWHMLDIHEGIDNILVCKDIHSIKDNLLTVRLLDGSVVTVDKQMNVVGRPRQFRLDKK